MKIREIEEYDLNSLLELYTQLHENPMPEKSKALSEIWNAILQDTNHHIIAAVEDGRQSAKFEMHIGLEAQGAQSKDGNTVLRRFRS